MNKKTSPSRRVRSEEQAALFFGVNFDTFARGFEIQGQAYEMATAVVVQEGALHVKSVGEANPFGYLAEGVCVADCAVKDEAWIFALCRDDVQLANGSACGPVQCSVLGVAFEGQNRCGFPFAGAAGAVAGSCSALVQLPWQRKRYTPSKSLSWRSCWRCCHCMLDGISWRMPAGTPFVSMSCRLCSESLIRDANA